MSRNILEMDAFVPPQTRELVRASAAYTGEPVAMQEDAVHKQIETLIAQCARDERKVAWQALQRTLPPQQLPKRSAWQAEWATSWQFTPERCAYVRAANPLLVRSAARGIMRIVNSQRLGPDGNPLDTPAGHDLTLVDFRELAQDYNADPIRLLKYFQSTGLFPWVNRHNRRADNLTCPGDMRGFLDLYPLAERPKEGEMTMLMLRRYGASDNLLLRIMRDERLFPVVREFEGRGGREVEFFTPPQIERIRANVEQLPMLDPTHESTLQQFLETFESELIARTAANNLGISCPERRLPGQGRGLCILHEDKARVQAEYEYLTTLQPGEMSTEDIAAALGVAYSTVRQHITPANRNRARDLHHAGTKGKVRVFPPEVAKDILERAKYPTLPPHLIPMSAIGRRLSNHDYGNISSRLQGISSGSTLIHLRSGDYAPEMRCFPWHTLRRLELRYAPPANSVLIEWERLPANEFDLDPEKIAYARAVQSRYVTDLRQVSRMPIQEYIEQQAALLGERPGRPAFPAGERPYPLGPPRAFSAEPLPVAAAVQPTALIPEAARLLPILPHIVPRKVELLPLVPTIVPRYAKLLPMLPVVVPRHANLLPLLPPVTPSHARLLPIAPPPPPTVVLESAKFLPIVAPPERVVPRYAKTLPILRPTPAQYAAQRAAERLRSDHWHPRGSGDGTDGLTSAHKLDVQQIASRTGVSPTEARETIETIDLRDCPPPMHTPRGTVYTGQALARILDHIVGISEASLERRTGFPGHVARQLLQPYGSEPVNDRYSPAMLNLLLVWRAPRGSVPLQGICMKIGWDEKRAREFLRRNFGRTEVYLLPSGEKAVHVDAVSYQLLIRQKYPGGENMPYVVLRERATSVWQHRGQIQEQSRRPIAEFEDWLRENPPTGNRGSGAFGWKQAANGDLLPHFRIDFLQRYYKHIRQKYETS